MVLNNYKKLKSTINDLIIDKHFNIYNRNGYEYILSKIKKQPEFYIYLIDFDGVKEMNKKIGYSEVNNIFRNIFDELKDKFIIGRAFSGDEIFFANKNINKYDINDIENVAKKYNIGIKSVYGICKKKNLYNDLETLINRLHLFINHYK